MTANQRYLVATGMRNEGPFIVEWVCWYRMLGFEILVATNDCTDHSTNLLEAFAQAGWLTHLPHLPREGQPPQKSALRHIINHPLAKQVDWTLICDVDEFLVLHEHDSIADFLGPPPHDFRAIAVHWKCFGDGGLEHYEDGLVHRQFRRCGLGQLPMNRHFKSILRAPLNYSRLGAHFPHGYTDDLGAPQNRVVDSSLQTMSQFADPDAYPIRFTPQEQITHKAAQMNHYILRAKESYDHKRDILSAAGFKVRYTDEFYKRHNKNGMRDITAYRFSQTFAGVHKAAMSLPDIKRLHHICCAEYIVRMAEKRGDTPETDPRFHHHMKLANRAAANRETSP